MMHQRKRALLYLIKSLNERETRISKTLLDKMLFVLRQEYGVGGMIKFYNFYPYRFGPFSNMFYLDLSDIESRGLMGKDFILAPDAISASEKAPKPVRDSISSLAERFDGKDIVRYVYGRYPGYTVKSELQTNKKEKGTPGVFTIGYEGKDLDIFLDTLIQNRIEAVIDVRANPFSMSFSFIGNRLEGYLGKVGIEYLHIPKLGIPGERRKNLISGADYEKLFQSYKERVISCESEKVQELADMAARRRIALLCFEADKDRCHRGVLGAELERVMGRPVIHL